MPLNATLLPCTLKIQNNFLWLGSRYSILRHFWHGYITFFEFNSISTNCNGKAALSFYTGDKPGSYTITIEGNDFNGNVATITKKDNGSARR